MSGRMCVWLLTTILLSTASPTQAQQPVKTPRIGVLMSGSPEPRRAVLEAFRQGLRELGYVEGKNIAIEYRFSEGKDERLPELATELVQLKVDIIVTSGIPPPLAAKKATKTIPIVMGVVGDAIGTGLVDSLARPGGNVTGFTLLGPELGGKRLEILNETVPKTITRCRAAKPGKSRHRLVSKGDRGCGEAFGPGASFHGSETARRISERFVRNEDGAGAGSHHFERHHVLQPASTNCKPRNQDRVAGYVSGERVCERWRSHVVRTESS